MSNANAFLLDLVVGVGMIIKSNLVVTFNLKKRIELGCLLNVECRPFYNKDEIDFDFKLNLEVVSSGH